MRAASYAGTPVLARGQGLSVCARGLLPTPQLGKHRLRERIGSRQKAFLKDMQHTHSLSRSVEHVHIHISVCLSLPSPCARTHTKAYQSMHSSGSTTCTSAPLRRHTRQYTSNPFDFGQCTGMSAFSLSPTVHVPTDLFNCNYPEKKDAKKILNLNELPTSISKKAMHKLTDLYTPVPKIQ